MRIQQITPNYGQNKANPNFKAGKIRIMNPGAFLTDHLEAIAKNDEFKKLAKFAGEKGNDLFIEKSYTLLNLYFNSIFPIKPDWKIGPSCQRLSACIESFRVDDMMRELENEHKERENDENRCNKALKLIDDFNNGRYIKQDKVQETVNAEKSFWQKLKDLF